MKSLKEKRNVMLASAGAVFYLTFRPVLDVMEHPQLGKLSDHPNYIALAIMGGLCAIGMVVWAIIIHRKLKQPVA